MVCAILLRTTPAPTAFGQSLGGVGLSREGTEVKLLPLLRQTAQQNPHRGAKIIALSSLTGVAGEAGLAAYGASKAALISLCETVSMEESMHGVTATALSPGYVDTDMSAWKHSDIQPDAMLRT